MWEKDQKIEEKGEKEEEGRKGGSGNLKGENRREGKEQGSRTSQMEKIATINFASNISLNPKFLANAAPFQYEPLPNLFLFIFLYIAFLNVFFSP